MNTILNEETNYQADESIRFSFLPTSKKAKITGTACLVFAVLAMASLLSPLLQAFLFWNFLLISASLGIFGFLEINSGKAWISNITWVISLVLITLLFIFAFGSFKDSQSWYFYGAFSIIVPILLTINALSSKSYGILKSFFPLIIPITLVFSAILLSYRTPHFAFLILPISWSVLGIIIHLESKNG